MQDWTQAAWLATAHDWIEAQLAELGAARTGPIEQPHVRPWATALRIPSTEGTLWFKANGPAQSYEAGVLELLAQRRPDAVPGLIAVDRQRGWMLMTDGGIRQPGVQARQEREPVVGSAEREEGIAVRREVDQQLGIQREHIEPAPQVSLGLDELTQLTVADDVSGDELRRLQGLAPWVADSCAQLTALGVPETIQHDDLHDGQVFVRDGRYLIFDWGDACVSHPFFTMSVTLEGVLAWGLDDVENSVDTAPFRDAFLEPFAAFAPRVELEAGMALALRLGWICRSLNYQAARQGFGPPYPEVFRDAVAVRLQMFVAGLADLGASPGHRFVRWPAPRGALPRYQPDRCLRPLSQKPGPSSSPRSPWSWTRMFKSRAPALAPTMHWQPG